MKSLSVLIIAGNESSVIRKCLKSCYFANEIILYTNSTDNTSKIAKKYFPKVKIVTNPQKQENFNFSQARNSVFKHSTSDWILYLDADERISQPLKDDIQKILSDDTPKYTNYDLPRANYFLDKRVRYGGNYPDYVKRLFLRQSFTGYTGVIHEQPNIQGPSQKLTNYLIHLTHRNLASMLNKSIKWTTIEANLLFSDNHPPVVWWRFIRMMFTKFWQRYVNQQMWRDGAVGIISVIFEMYDTYMIYANLYELQLNKTHA